MWMSKSSPLAQVELVQALGEIMPTGGPAAKVIEKDIQAGEALINVISSVLIPTTQASPK